MIHLLCTGNLLTLSQFCSSVFPQIYLWGSPFLVRFLLMWPFFNPSIEVVTCRLRGWYMLGAFLLPAFICLARECQDLLSPFCSDHLLLILLHNLQPVRYYSMSFILATVSHIIDSSIPSHLNVLLLHTLWVMWDPVFNTAV